jgi:hypothetical protein
MSNISEVLRNTAKHHFESDGVDWMLRNFGAPKIEHLGPKHKFSSCYMQKVSEVLRNTFKYHFGSNGVK